MPEAVTTPQKRSLKDPMADGQKSSEKASAPVSKKLRKGCKAAESSVKKAEVEEVTADKSAEKLDMEIENLFAGDDDPAPEREEVEVETDVPAAELEEKNDNDDADKEEDGEDAHEEDENNKGLSSKAKLVQTFPSQKANLYLDEECLKLVATTRKKTCKIPILFSCNRGTYARVTKDSEDSLYPWELKKKSAKVCFEGCLQSIGDILKSKAEVTSIYGFKLTKAKKICSLEDDAGQAARLVSKLLSVCSRALN